LGKLYQKVTDYLEDPPAPDSIIVEIGSDRHEGSTRFFCDLADAHQKEFYSVDIDTAVQSRIPGKINWQTQSGSVWCRETLPEIDRPIWILYLDNFDYNWDINQWNDHINQQKTWYQTRGLTMDNQSCQVEHMKQLLGAWPYLGPGSVVVLDDTYTLNDCWVGKGGGCVIYMLSQGWKIQVAEEFGVIMKYSVDNTR
jgi:hypothetical protein